MTQLKKLSKKAQREFYQKQRGSWNGINPTTKVVKNKKKYDRNTEKQNVRKELRTF